MVKDKYYRFLRIKWAAEDKMNAALNDALHAHETVEHMTADGDEVLVLVSVKGKK